METKTQLDTAIDMVAYYTKGIDETVKKYGTGVRPSWVSADLAIDRDRRDAWKQEIKRLAIEE